MTDRDRLLGLLNDFGITPVDPAKHSYPACDVILEAEEGGVKGYYDFIVVFSFDNESGKFLEAGIWE